MKKKILISLTPQFGYHTDSYKYCQWLDKSLYDITYIGFDFGYLRYEIEDVRVIYIPIHTNKITRYLIYISYICSEINNHHYDVVFQVDCRAALIIRLLNLNQRMILDIRTGSLYVSNLKRNCFNYFIWFKSLFYKNVSVISENLRSQLHLSITKSTIIPLGADIMNFEDKKFEEIKLFYIGTLTNRNIEDTIKGLGKYLKNSTDRINISYDIVGFDSEEKLKILKDVINEYNLKGIVKYHGPKYHNEATIFFKECNVGVVYIPMTAWYDCQPSTKLYECLLAGMPVIATNTKENRNEITMDEGVLIDDSPSGFCDGIKHIVENKNRYSSSQIKSRFEKSTWKYIISNQLEPYLQNVIKNE